MIARLGNRDPLTSPALLLLFYPVLAPGWLQTSGSWFSRFKNCEQRGNLGRMVHVKPLVVACVGGD